MSEIIIDHVGRKGDGVAFENGQEVYVPFALAGEHLEVFGSGPRRELSNVIKASENRIDPVCKHFTICGGCQLQHMSEDSYLNWKMTLLSEQLTKAGIEIEPEPIVSFADQSRRKVVFSAKQTSTGLLLGFQERAGNMVIDIEECPVTIPAITDRLDDIRDLVRSVPGAKVPLHISVLAARNGLDIDIQEARELTGSDRQTLVRKTVDLGFLRLSVNGETLVEAQKPELKMADCIVVPPPGAFVQAIAEAEHGMETLVTEHLKSCKTVADLYSGIGTFALRLAANSTVLAVEANAAALDSLNQAWRATAGKLKQIKTETRNLERRPLGFAELKKTDGLVFDPPRAGAELQAKQIAKSKVKKIAAVSCNPVTLARDLEILIAGGYKVLKIVPFDQFRYTPHLETVVLLER